MGLLQLSTLHADSRLAKKYTTMVTNTLAYCDTELITEVKRFIVQILDRIESEEKDSETQIIINLGANEIAPLTNFHLNTNLVKLLSRCGALRPQCAPLG